MSDFNVIKPSEGALYWYELAKFASPFATVGSFVLQAISFFSDGQAAAFERLFRKLDELSQQIAELKQSIEAKLDDMVLKERFGEVLGIKESLEEYHRILSSGILDNIVTDSAQTKRKILAWLDDDRTPVAYLHAYNTLACTLIPLRTASFCLYRRPAPEIKALVKEEINDLLSRSAAAIKAGDTVGRNRVAYEEKVVLVDELGPVWGTDFIIKVDKTVAYTDSFIPRSNDLQAVRNKAKAHFEELKEQNGWEACQPLEKCFSDAHMLLRQMEGSHRH